MIEPKKTYRQAKDYYRELRESVYRGVEADLRDQGIEGVRFTEISAAALAIAEAWRDLYPEHREAHIPGWNWPVELARFRLRPRRVEAALWFEDELCGLALGRISDRHIVATIHLVEANPAGNPLGGVVVALMTRFLDAIGARVGCREVSLERPVAGLVDFYMEAGFKRKEFDGDQVVRLKKFLKLPI